MRWYPRGYRRSVDRLSLIHIFDRWHDMIGIPTLADAILDRVIHNAYRIDLTGERCV